MGKVFRCIEAGPLIFSAEPNGNRVSCQRLISDDVIEMLSDLDRYIFLTPLKM